MIFAYVSPGVFRHRGLEGEPEFWFTEEVKRRCGGRGAAGAGDAVVRELFRAAQEAQAAQSTVLVVLPPSEAKRLLRRPRVSDKYAYYAFRRSFVEEKTGTTYACDPQ